MSDSVQEVVGSALEAIHRVGIPTNSNDCLLVLGLVGDVFRLRDRMSVPAKLPLQIKRFFDDVSSQIVEDALGSISERSPSELAAQIDTTDAASLAISVCDRDRLTSVQVALEQLRLYRRWSSEYLRNVERFYHSLTAYDAWLETQYARLKLKPSDLQGHLGARRAFCVP